METTLPPVSPSPDRGRAIRIIVSLGIVLAFVIYITYYFEPKPQIETKPEIQVADQGTGAGEHTVAETDKTADWKTYKNAEYGFEFRYPSDWRMKPEKTVSLGERFGLVKTALATLESNAEMEFYERAGGQAVFSTWIQDPKRDKTPVLEDDYKDDPGYYQYSGYNSAPLGIFVYVYDDWNSDKQNEAMRGHEGFLQYEETIFNGIKAYKGTCAADKDSEDYWPDNPCNWSLEKIEVEKNGRLYVIFYAGVDYASDFDEFLSDFKFTEKTDSTTDETAAWKTYKNTAYGFEIKYPKDVFSLADNSEYDAYGGILNSYDMSSIEGSDTPSMSVTVKGIKDSAYNDAKDDVAKANAYTTVSGPETRQINGEEVFITTSEWYGDSPSRSYFFPDFVLIFSYAHKELEVNFVNYEQKILSILRFAD